MPRSVTKKPRCSSRRAIRFRRLRRPGTWLRRLQLEEAAEQFGLTKRWSTRTRNSTCGRARHRRRPRYPPATTRSSSRRCRCGRIHIVCPTPFFCSSSRFGEAWHCTCCRRRFRVRNQKETRYCYDEMEKQAALGDLGRGQITRFRDLVKSAQKVRPLHWEDIRFDRGHRKRAEPSGNAGLFMGKNTPPPKIHHREPPRGKDDGEARARTKTFTTTSATTSSRRRAAWTLEMEHVARSGDVQHTSTTRATLSSSAPFRTSTTD